MIEISPLGIIIKDSGLVISAISGGLALLSSLIRMAVLDMEKMKDIKERLKEQQKIIKEATKKGQIKKAQKAQEELMKLTIENLKHGMKPMIYTIIPFILIFGWLKGEYGNAGTVATLFGFNLDWFWWYLISAMIISMILNKLFKLT